MSKNEKQNKQKQPHAAYKKLSHILEYICVKRQSEKMYSI